jgi:hypothetical protein
MTSHYELYASRDLARRDRTVGEHVLSMAELPLLCDGNVSGPTVAL